MAALPTVAEGQAGHVEHHNTLHARFNALAPGGTATEIIPDELIVPVGTGDYPATDSGHLAEMYNHLMAHLNGARAAGFAINVQHPDFVGPDGARGLTNDAPGINAAFEFATGNAAAGTDFRSIWFPGLNKLGARATYRVDEPVRVLTGCDILGSKSIIRAGPTFDFTTRISDGSYNGNLENAVLSFYNPGGDGPGRYAQGRYRGGHIQVDCDNIDGSIGIIMDCQQQTQMEGIRVDDFKRWGMLMWGQQGVFTDFMLTGDNSLGWPEIGDHDLIGLQIGAPDYVTTGGTAPGDPGSMMYFYSLNVQYCRVGIYQYNGIGANSFRDVHFELGGTSDNPAEPIVGFEIRQGQAYIDQAWITPGTGGSPVRGYNIFLRAGNDLADVTQYNYSYDIQHVFSNSGGAPGSNDKTYLVRDYGRNHHIQAWGETRKSVLNPPAEGAVRLAHRIIGANLRNGTWPARYLWAMLGDEGGLLTIGVNNANTPDADQLPILRIRSGATQFGHLASFQDQNGVERLVVGADGMALMPAFTEAQILALPVRAGKGPLYATDTGVLWYADGFTNSWKELAVNP